MDEYELRQIERALVGASAPAAAAVAFAAILRLGELGRDGALAYAYHARLAAFEPEIVETLAVGLRALT